MALQKNNLEIPFALGLDTKTDPWQLQPGRFLSLINSVFTTAKRLTKRNGYPVLTELPSGSGATTLTTFKNNLTAIGTSLYAYNAPANEWENRGHIQTIQLSVQSIVRTQYSQTVVDAAISPGGLVCTAFLDGDGAYKYQISDNTTSQVLVSITNLESGAALARTFILGNYFVITYLVVISATPRLRYIAIPLNNVTNPGSPQTISSQVSSITAGYDGAIINTSLYIAWDGSDGGGAIRVSYIDSNLAQHNTVALAGHTATLMSVTGDTTGSTPVIWVSAHAGAANDTYSYALNPQLVVILAATHSTSVDDIQQITSTAQNMVLTLFYQVLNNYSYASIRSDFVRKVTVTQAGVVGTPSVVLRSVGLASKAFMIDFVTYMLTVYGGAFQPTYFLIDENGNVIARLAYSNGAGYAINEILPSASIDDTIVRMGYLLKDLIIPVNKSQAATSVNNVYTQTGVNTVAFDFASRNLSTAEIGGSLNIAGGFLWMYDGVKPVEQGFHVWPEDILATPGNTGASMTEQQYYYQVVYEWTDGQGLLHRSAPSIPVGALLAAGNDQVTLNIPTLRLTYKIAPNKVRIVIYRWSTGQQTYYQVTSVTAPLLNNPSVDSVVYIDTQADSSIVGNNIIYTTGGVVENIAGPACSVLSLFKNRLMLVDAEDKNLIWYSKQVIESTPVEMSDLFTRFVSPTTGAQGSTGELTALSPLDDKLIMFKRSAIYYMIGEGPDNTGSQNDFSEPVFITATVGTDNQHSIVFIPSGLMFQSNKGVWLLGRDMSTSYIGAAVEIFNGVPVTSSVTVPNTNQVRFTLREGASSTLYNGLHTVLNSSGMVLQEKENTYTDGLGGTMLMYDYFYDQWGEFNVNSGPVLLSLTTSWFNLAGVQGFERLYFFYILAKYLSPHKLNVSIAYDYNDSNEQSILISPDNYAGPYGTGIYGQGDNYGGPGNVEQWRVFPQKQKCEAFKLTIQEVWDASMGIVPGQGLDITGLNLVVGAKKAYRPSSAARSVG